jgi:hypothetical protein
MVISSRSPAVLALLVSFVAACGEREPLEADTTPPAPAVAASPSGGNGGAAGANGGATSPLPPSTDSQPKPSEPVTPSSPMTAAPAGTFKCICSRAPGRTTTVPGITCPPGTGASASATIGPEGGKLFFDQMHSGVALVLEVPSGAVSTPTTFKVTELAQDTPAELQDYTAIYSFEPTGLALARPARLRLPWNVELAQGAGYETPPGLSVYRAASPSGAWERLGDSYVNAGFSQASLDRLGFVLAGFPASLCAPR